ncbi:CAP domain-containing protein [Actinokineospora soli]|uniref:CAP domain-containing protein n=1 Tax=Actinokineospora soli TaxID=1048753 RepID=A0ABW2TVZ2_9PSEU
MHEATPDTVALNLTDPPVTTAPPPSPQSPSTTTSSKVVTTTKATPKPTTTTPKPTTTKPTTTTTTTERPDLSVDAEVLALVNAERADAGCAAVKLDARLTEAGQGHSEDMSDNDYFSHTSLDGRSFVDRAREAGYRSPGAENIARGQQSAEQVMEAWMDSPATARTSSTAT